jgi:hypothetical protein
MCEFDFRQAQAQAQMIQSDRIAILLVRTAPMAICQLCSLQVLSIAGGPLRRASPADLVWPAKRLSIARCGGDRNINSQQIGRLQVTR